MFTGIIRAIGVVESMDVTAAGCVLVVDAHALAADNAHAAPLRVGDSVAVNGACLTISELRTTRARFDVSPETLARCLIGEWAVGHLVNLETALTPHTPLGGHLVAGHVDGVGTLVARESAAEFTRLQFVAPRAIGRLIAPKGAVAVDGVSLTTNEVWDLPDTAHSSEQTNEQTGEQMSEQTGFEVMLVPHTLHATTLDGIQPGMGVHLEVDSVARYVQRLLQSTNLMPSQ